MKTLKTASLKTASLKTASLKTAKKQLQSGLQQCSRCKVFYSISFFRSEPKTTVCLGCLRKAAREWNKSHLKTYRIYQKKWRIENRDRLNAQIHAKRLADPEGERAKMRAYSAVRRAKRRADRGTPICLKCGSARNVEMHHVDYNMGLKVIPLCKRCHHMLHSADRDGANRLPWEVSRENS